MSELSLLKDDLNSGLREPTTPLTIYDFVVEHPPTWVVRFGKVLYYEHGVIDILEPSERREAVFTILWRPYQELFRYHLPKAQNIYLNKNRFLKKFSSSMGMNRAPLSNEDIPSLDSFSGQEEKLTEILQSYQRQVERGMRSDFANFEKLEESVISFNGHVAIHEKVNFKVKKGLIRKFKAHIQRNQLYTVCPDSKRLIVLHTSVDIGKEEEYDKYFDNFFSTFKCH